MKALPICLMLMSLMIASRPVGAADTEPLGLLPDAPQLKKPLFVYRDESVADKDKTKDAQYSWLAFHGSQQLDAKKDFDSNGAWLKVHAAQLGKYTFVLTCKHANSKEDRWARTVEVQAEAAKGTAAGPVSKNSSQSKKVYRSAIEATVKSTAGDIIDSVLAGRTGTSDSRTATQYQQNAQKAWGDALRVKLAVALEDIARSALLEHSNTPVIVDKTKTRWKEVVGSDSGWAVMEKLFKDVDIEFEATTVTDNSADAILALAALATALREDALPPREAYRQVQRLQLQESSPTTTAAYTMEPCRPRSRFFQR